MFQAERHSFVWSKYFLLPTYWDVPQMFSKVHYFWKTIFLFFRFLVHFSARVESQLRSRLIHAVSVAHGLVSVATCGQLKEILYKWIFVNVVKKVYPNHSVKIDNTYAPFLLPRFVHPQQRQVITFRNEELLSRGVTLLGAICWSEEDRWHRQHRDNGLYHKRTKLKKN